MVSEPAELVGYPDHLKRLAPFGPFRAAVSRVVDGDTLYCLLDLGFNVYAYHSIRVEGIDAPEVFSGTPEERQRGEAARNHVEHLLAESGRHVVLYSEKYSQSFGRYVAYVTLADGSNLGDRMVDAGHATPIP